MNPGLVAAAAAVAAAAGPWQAAAIQRELPARTRTPPAAALAGTGGAAAAGLALLLPAALVPAVVAFLVLALPAAAVDARSRRLPDRLTLPGYPLLAGCLVAGSVPAGHAGRLAAATAGCAAALALFGAQILAAPTSGPGVGDLKLSGQVGALLGWAGAVPWLAGLLAAYLLYLAAAVAIALHGRAPLRGHHPLGPALVAGTLLALGAFAR